MGLFFYNKIGSIIPAVDLPTTEIIEPNKQARFGKTFPDLFDRMKSKKTLLKRGV